MNDQSGITSDKFLGSNTLEVKFHEFQIHTSFLDTGRVEGRFNHRHEGLKAHELKDGLWIQESGKLSFSFNVDWCNTGHSEASTIFSGFVFNNNSEQNYFFISWLLSLKTITDQCSYTKIGVFSSESQILTCSSVPYPTVYKAFL